MPLGVDKISDFCFKEGVGARMRDCLRQQSQDLEKTLLGGLRSDLKCNVILRLYANILWNEMAIGNRLDMNKRPRKPNTQVGEVYASVGGVQGRSCGGWWLVDV